MNRTKSPIAIALAGAVCLAVAGCGAMGSSLDKSPLLGNRSGSNEALSRIVKNDPFPTAAQAGLPSQAAAKQ